MKRLPDNIGKLKKAMELLQDVLNAMEHQSHRASSAPRTRRSKNAAAELREIVKSERQAGVPVTEIAARHGVTSAYIYMISDVESAERSSHGA